MGSKFLYLAAVALVVGGLFGGVDVRVNQDNLHILQNEPSITINPGVQNNIVVAYNEAPGYGYGLGISFSNDGGVTWGDNQIGPIWGIEGDPSADADLSGNVFVGFMSYKPNFFTDTNGIYVAVSPDGGITWPTITAVDLHRNSPRTPVPSPINPICALITILQVRLKTTFTSRGRGTTPTESMPTFILRLPTMPALLLQLHRK